VTIITKHDTEKEGERNDGKAGRVGLFVAGYTVCINHSLHRILDLTRFEVSRWGQMWRIIVSWSPTIKLNSGENCKSLLDLLFHSDGCPNETSECCVFDRTLL